MNIELRFKRRNAVFVVSLCSVVYFILMWTAEMDTRSGSDSHITYFSDVYEPTGQDQMILIWLPFLHVNMSFIFNNTLKQCAYTCYITDDKKSADSANAIIFHQYDLWPREVNWEIGTRVTVELPKRPNYDQIWALWNMEPPVNIFADLSVLNGLFNWTVWYRQDATIWLPYGAKAKLNETELKVATGVYKHRNYYRQKTKGICGRISNCADAAFRYKLIQRLEEHLDIDMFGGCYGQPASDDVIAAYKFYLGFENSNCKDYVTEKYWSTLNREQIPIVNWRQDISPDMVIPGSYINVYDFPTVKAAAEYINSVLKNETLYNSYFDWKLKYKNAQLPPICSLCELLHTRKVPTQVFSRLDLWLRNDTCPKVTVLRKKLQNYWHDLWERGLW